MTPKPHDIDGVKRSDDRAVAADVEHYEDGGRVVLFDVDNPLAWVEASRAVRLRDVA